MADEAVIKVEDLWKRYGLPLMPTLRQVGRRLRGQPYDRAADGPWSLREVNLEIRRGETVGIIGRNGAGKSTLLKVLAGVTPPTYGKVQVKGRVFPMIELNAGLHPELTGRENVYLLGAIMGMSRAQVNRLMPEIEDFCELGEWFDRPVRKYSSGMLARLGFSVAIKVESDILLVDEVLAVGDLRFQQKCYNEIARLRSESEKSILLVSHNLRMISRLADRALLFKDGQILVEGGAEEVVNRYMEIATAEELGRTHVQPQIEYSDQLILKNIRLLDEDGRPCEVVKTGESITIHVEFDAQKIFDSPLIGLGITSSDLFQIAGVHSWHIGSYQLAGHSVVDCHIKNLKILPGFYFIDLGVTSTYNGARLFVSRNLMRFQVIADHEQYPTMRHTGLIALDAKWHIQAEEGIVLKPESNGFEAV